MGSILGFLAAVLAKPRLAPPLLAKAESAISQSFVTLVVLVFGEVIFSVLLLSLWQRPVRASKG
jgi:hypothetical protein